MSDNVGIRDRDGANVDVSAEDLGGGVKVQRVRVQHGSARAPVDTSAANPLPISGSVVLGTGVATIGAVGLVSSIPAGSNAIGTVEVTRLASLPAGANSIGTVVLGAGSAAIGRVDIGSALPAGTNSIGTVVLGAGSAAVGRVDLNSSIPSGSNSIGSVSSRTIPSTTGGLTTYRNPDLDEVKQQVKSGSGQLYGWYCSNTSATTDIFIHFYAALATNVTVGTTTPLWSMHLGPGDKANAFGETGIALASGITVAATTDIGGRSAPATGQCICNLFYF